MNSNLMTIEMLGQQIQQEAKEQEKQKKLEEEQKKDQVKLDKLMKNGKVANPLLLIFFLEMQGMKSLSKSANPLMERNQTLHDEYLAKEKEISEMNKKLKALTSKKDYSQEDQKEATDLQNKIAQAQVDAQQIQQKGQSLWSINFQPVENNIQSTSNMAASAIQLLDQSRQSFLNTTN